ncbi:MAG TPA: hypothetical protein VFL91_21300 [Thermomicrobiales bacterium]|nr:hypothetical protein [Thermomicrobiales bacterium]
MRAWWPLRKRYKIVVPTEVIRDMAADAGVPEDHIRDELAVRPPALQLLAWIGFEDSRGWRVS